ncbi:unnamed protein product, partial [Phaeothamnion confervicola]
SFSEPSLLRGKGRQAKQAPAEIRQPGLFGDQFNEATRLVQLDTYDGFRFEAHKTITPAFVTTHTLFLGSSLVQGGNYYQFGVNLAEDADKLVMGRLDTTGGLDGRIFLPLLKNVNTKLQFQASPL